MDRKCLSKGLLNYNNCLNINYVMGIPIKNIWRQIKKTISHYRLQKLQIIYNVPNIKDLGESKIFNLIIIINIMFKLI